MGSGSTTHPDTARGPGRQPGWTEPRAGGRGGIPPGLPARAPGRKEGPAPLPAAWVSSPTQRHPVQAPGSGAAAHPPLRPAPAPPARRVPERGPGQVPVLADAHVLGHRDDAVESSNHDGGALKLREPLRTELGAKRCPPRPLGRIGARRPRPALPRPRPGAGRGGDVLGPAGARELGRGLARPARPSPLQSVSAPRCRTGSHAVAARLPLAQPLPGKRF